MLPRRRSKFGAVKTTVDGIKFDSKREAEHYLTLKMLQRSGLISNLQLQPKYPLIVDGRPVLIRSKGYPKGRKASYIADFRYIDEHGKLVVEDVKGMDTPVSKLKRAIVEAMHPGLEITIIK